MTELAPPRRVLVVEDDVALRELIVQMLLVTGFEASGVGWGGEAVARASADPDLLLLLDQRLPDMTGRDVIETLAGQGIEVPFIVMTGQGDERLAVEMMKLGASDYLVKDPELVGVLPGVLDRVFRSLATERRLREAERERERLQAQLLHAQKMESVGRLAGGVAHDFNNMLGVILGHAEMALAQIDPGSPVFGDLTAILKAARHSADLTQQLLAFARRQTVAPRLIDLNTAVAEMLTMLRRLVGEQVELVWLPGEDVGAIKIDPSQVDQLLANLCVNARDSIADTGRITISTASVTLDEHQCSNHPGVPPGDYVRLSVADDGCGMDHATLASIFEPFFTTKPQGAGTGLGLATVHGIVSQNGGAIEVESAPGRGSRFTVHLPRHTGRLQASAHQEAEVAPRRGGETILLVEDDPAILKMTSRMLEGQGYKVLAAASPAIGLRLAETYAGRIDLLMTDVVMPEMNGRDLARGIVSLRPGVQRLFMSGYTADVIARQGVLDPEVHFIQKPFSIDSLCEKVRAVLDIR